MSRKVVVIALSGWKQSGKDTVSEIVLNDLLKNNNIVYVTSFAEPLKHMIKNMFGVECENITDKEKEKLDITTSLFKKPKSYRELCIYFGENMKKWMGTQDLWKIALKNRVINFVNEQTEKDVFVIIPDVRYIPEIELLKEFSDMGYEVKHYCIFRKTSVPKWAKNGIKPWEDKVYSKTHGVDRSEYEWCSINPTFDGYIYNDGTVDDLSNEVYNKIINHIS